LAIRENLDWPASDFERGEEAVEEITFVVMPDGSISNKKLALSRNHNCDGCQQAAIDAVSKLDQWIPAVKDGRKVAVKMTLPIRFVPIS
jgi:TonB family protein